MNKYQMAIFKKILSNEKKKPKILRQDKMYFNRLDREARQVRRLTRRIKRLSNNYDN